MRHLLHFTIALALIGCGNDSSSKITGTGEEVIHLPPAGEPCWEDVYYVTVTNNGKFQVAQRIIFDSDSTFSMVITALEDSPDGPIKEGWVVNREDRTAWLIDGHPHYYEFLSQRVQRRLYMANTDTWETLGPSEPKVISWTLGVDGILRDYNNTGEWSVCLSPVQL